MKAKARGSSTSTPIIAFLFLALGYYLGRQHELIKSVHDSPPPVVDLSPLAIPSESRKQVTNTTTKNKGKQTTTTNFQLHPSIKIHEDSKLFSELVYPEVRKIVESGEVKNCPPAPVKPYLDILRNIEEDPLYYEDVNIKTINSCPVVFLFYFEGMSKIADTFFEYYSNIKTKRCINFIVSSRWIDKPGTKEMAENKGYKIVGRHYPKQDKTISMTLHDIRKLYGDDVLVSVNDLDHLLVWFDHSQKPHRYSSYTDIVRLYLYELLSTKGCSNQNVMEKYVVPCTCLMEKNEKYVSVRDEVVWSEYGTTNRFHPTANFYLNRSLAIPEDGDSNYVYSIGTVFANLRKYDVSMLK